MSVGKILISEADVAKFAPDRPIVLDRDTVITPSALDRASRLRIPIVRTAEAASTASAPATVAPGCEPCLCRLPDGTYLLTVANGRRTVLSIAPDGSAPRAISATGCSHARPQ